MTISDSSVQVCKCGHGIPFHRNSEGICLHPDPERTRTCNCNKFRLKWYIDKKLGRIDVNDES